ncbi:carbohydrate-binding domain-containing protein [Belnapia rosea]|uniref:carbohydrate-binding domain-containing protein n=1 Tax=Belnapia rosea TaxID=938405 RepID=UPI000B821C76|nr:carbohydrate-binding domain-containing protein [Belnapia rosea]
MSVDGQQIGGVLTASASHTAGQDDIATMKGNRSAVSHKLTVRFLNDEYGGSAATDRTLHARGITCNGVELAKGTADLTRNGPVGFTFADTGTAANAACCSPDAAAPRTG